MTQPEHTDLLGDTDLAIRQVAELATLQLDGSTRFSVLNPTTYSTNGNGDVLPVFPNMPKGLTGAFVYESSRVILSSQNEWGGSYIEPFLAAWPIIVNLNPDPAQPGLCFVRFMCTGAEVTGNGSGAWFASAPAKSGQPVYLSGIAWGPA